MQIMVTDHPLLRPAAFISRFPTQLGAARLADHGLALLRPGGGETAPVQRTEALRQAVRAMLRAGGYKPTGRGKPASEYLVRAAEEGGLGSINAAVDIANGVSLHSGFPISVVDAERLTPPLEIDIGAAQQAYVFNRAGHEIDVAGLPCLFDAAGPCANAVKDAQRTKTDDSTQATLSLVWGVAGFEEQLEATVAWYRDLVAGAGAATETVIP
jgi:DNA/RNA-binding domain of Phe-tRNA-synthetase-like protein